MRGTSSTVRLILLLVMAACHRTRGVVPPAPPSYVVGPAETTCTSLGLSSVSGPEECQAAAGTYEVGQIAQTTGKYAGEWSDGDGEDWGYPHGCYTSLADPGCYLPDSGCYLPDVKWNNAEHTPGYSGYYMGRPVCRAGTRLPSAVHEAAYLAPPPAGATPPATPPLSVSKPRRPPPATLSGASETHPEPAPRPEPRIPFAAIVGAVFGVAALGMLAGIVFYYRTRNGGRKSRSLQLSQCDDPPDAAPARRAPSQAPITLRVLSITKRGGAPGAREAHRRGRVGRAGRAAAIPGSGSAVPQAGRAVVGGEGTNDAVLGVRLRFGRSRVVVTVPNRGSYCTFCSFGDGQVRVSCLMPDRSLSCVLVRSLSPVSNAVLVGRRRRPGGRARYTFPRQRPSGARCVSPWSS